MKIEDRPSPNFNARDHAVDTLVLHYTGMATGEAALARLLDPGAEVSAHYLVWEDGGITRLVGEADRAWHAGVACWMGESNLNARSVGIEIVNGGHDVPRPDGRLPPYPDAQIGAVIALARDILTRHDIPPTRIVGHSDIAPARKTDPGEHFPWARLAKAGIGLFPPFSEGFLAIPVVQAFGPGDAGRAVMRLQAGLAGIGYGVEATGVFDAATEAAVRAFQRRFLPQRLSGRGCDATRVRIEQIRLAYLSA